MEPSKLRRGAYLVLGSVVAASLSWTGVAAGVGEAPSATGVGMLRVTTSPAVHPGPANTSTFVCSRSSRTKSGSSRNGPDVPPRRSPK